MGFLNSLGFGHAKTKADWDERIVVMNRELANLQARLESAKAMYGNKQPAVIAGFKAQIAQKKADIANAKIERRNAPK